MLNAIIDISHHNGPVDFAAARADGILGVIHKASQGRGGRDPAYALNRERALAAGHLWGAYHFGTGGDGATQAAAFLKIVDPDPKTLLVLDFEPNPTGSSMSLAEARDFVTHVAERTGRFPGLYSGHYIKELLGSRVDPLLQRCWLWLAQYGRRPVVPKCWSTWTLWQYTDGKAGNPPHQVAGIGRCDRDIFNGDEAALRRLWRV